MELGRSLLVGARRLLGDEGLGETSDDIADAEILEHVISAVVWGGMSFFAYLQAYHIGFVPNKNNGDQWMMKITLLHACTAYAVYFIIANPWLYVMNQGWRVERVVYLYRALEAAHLVECWLYVAIKTDMKSDMQGGQGQMGVKNWTNMCTIYMYGLIVCFVVSFGGMIITNRLIFEKLYWVGWVTIVFGACNGLYSLLKIRKRIKDLNAKSVLMRLKSEHSQSQSMRARRTSMRLALDSTETTKENELVDTPLITCPKTGSLILPEKGVEDEGITLTANEAKQLQLAKILFKKAIGMGFVGTLGLIYLLIKLKPPYDLEEPVVETKAEFKPDLASVVYIIITCYMLYLFYVPFKFGEKKK